MRSIRYIANDILVDQEGTQTQLLKSGPYAFNMQNHSMRVFDGKAAVFPIDAPDNAKPVIVKGGHKLLLNGDLANPTHFDKDRVKDGLYAWSSLRSEYLGAANESLASEYAGVDGFDPGWFWDQNLLGYTWLPGDGMMSSPFGFGFYSPFYLNGGGFMYGHGYYGRGNYGRGAMDQEAVSADKVVMLVVAQELGWAAVAFTAEEVSTAAAAVTAVVVHTGRRVKPSTVSRADR